VFGNGSSPAVPAGGTAQTYQGSVNYAGNHTLDDLSNASDVLSALTTASDHLPVVADYSLIGVNPYRYYVGPASGTWNTTASWSGADHGAPGFSVPPDGVVAFVDPTVNTAITFDGNYPGVGLVELDLIGMSG